MLQKILGRILGCALLSCCGSAMAFTLINVPGNFVTDTYTLNTQVQPIAGTIRSQIFGLRRAAGSQKTTQVGGLQLAANDRSGGASDVNYLAQAAGGTSDAGSSGGAANTQALWISSTIDSLENTFAPTAFYGGTQNVMIGYDYTRSSRYVLGISGGYEASNFVTKFNSGNEKTGGYNANPYFAWLISDAWTLDLIGGYGWFNTDQSRTVGDVAVPGATDAIDSSFYSNRAFASSNLTNVSTFGGWKLTGSLGYLWSERRQHGFTEDGPAGGLSLPGSKQTSVQWNLLGEVAYGRGESETYFGARYEDIRHYQNSPFPGAANDPTSFVLAAGWRYFGKGLTANFAFNGRVGQEQVKEHGFAMTLRMDL